MGTLRVDARRPAPAAEHPTRCIDPTEVDCAPHAIERRVRRVLTSCPGLTVSDLVVHRIRDGVCLTGIIESMNDNTDVCGLVREAAGVDQVLNRLLVRSGAGE